MDQLTATQQVTENLQYKLRMEGSLNFRVYKPKKGSEHIVAQFNRVADAHKLKEAIDAEKKFIATIKPVGNQFVIDLTVKQAQKILDKGEKSLFNKMIVELRPRASGKKKAPKVKKANGAKMKRNVNPFIQKVIESYKKEYALKGDISLSKTLTAKKTPLLVVTFSDKASAKTLLRTVFDSNKEPTKVAGTYQVKIGERSFIRLSDTAEEGKAEFAEIMNALK